MALQAHFFKWLLFLRPPPPLIKTNVKTTEKSPENKKCARTHLHVEEIISIKD